MATDYSNWKPPAGSSVLAGPGFAKEWEFQNSAAEQPGVGQPNLGELLNWSVIPGVPGSVFANSGYGDLPRTDNQALDSWLKANGYKIMQSGSGGKIGYRWIQDASGKVIGQPTAYEKGSDKTFLAGAALAAALAAPAVLAAAGAAPTAGAAATNAALAESAVGTAGYGASSAGLGGGAGVLAGAGATNPALIESAVGTSGYGASSAGAGGGAGTLAGAGATNPALIESAAGTPGYGPSSASAGGSNSGPIGAGAPGAGTGPFQMGPNPTTPTAPATPTAQPPAAPPAATPTAPPVTPAAGGVPGAYGPGISDKIVDKALDVGAGLAGGLALDAFVGPPAPSGTTTPTAQTAAEQAAANSSAAQETTALGRPNVTNPFGSSTWKRVPDATVPGGFRWENEIAFSDDQQALYDRTVGNQQSLLDTSGKLLEDIDANFSTPFNFGRYGQAERVNSDPNNFLTQRDQVTQALYDRLTRNRLPQMERDRAQIDNTLRNQGLTPGSEAYNNAMKLLLDAQSGELQDYNSRSIEAGGLEQSRLNTDLRQNVGFNNTVRTNNINEGLLERNMPLTDYNSLTQGTAPTLPTFQPYGSGAVTPVNTVGIQQNANQNAIDLYNQQMARYQSILNFGTSLAGG